MHRCPYAVELLLKAGASLNSSGWTPLDQSTMAGGFLPGILHLMIFGGMQTKLAGTIARINSLLQDHNGYPRLLYCHSKLVKEYLKYHPSGPHPTPQKLYEICEQRQEIFLSTSLHIPLVNIIQYYCHYLGPLPSK